MRRASLKGEPLLPSLGLLLLCTVGAVGEIPRSGPTCQVQFVVSAPEPAADAPPAIYCALSIDGWPEGGRELPRVGPGLYAASWPIAAETALEYKFLRQRSWKTVEKGAQGEEIANRCFTVPLDLDEVIVFHQVQRWADLAEAKRRGSNLGSTLSAPMAPTESRLTGELRYHHEFKSPELSNSRTIIVYLPPGYDRNTEERYPVLYMNDGNNLFDARTSFIGVEWGVDETAEELIKQGRIRPTIIVGIYNTPDRVAEYSPFPDAKHGGGRAADYLNFIERTLKPFVDRTYRTLPDREHTGMAGSSMGGLVTLYAICERPEVFGVGAALSTTLWWGDWGILERVRTATVPPKTRLWIDVDLLEGLGSPEGEAATGRFEELKSHLGAKHLESLNCVTIPGGTHDEGAWSKRMEQVLIFLFPPV